MGRMEPPNDKIHYGGARLGTDFRHGTDGGHGMTKSITEVGDWRQISGFVRLEPQKDKSSTEVIDVGHISVTGRRGHRNDKINYGNDRFEAYFGHGTDGAPE